MIAQDHGQGVIMVPDDHPIFHAIYNGHIGGIAHTNVIAIDYQQLISWLITQTFA